jgi:cell wall-associated NlpC family hydrolase
MLTQETRNSIIAEARTWLGTKYVPNGRIKQAGCDCATFLLEVVVRLGLVPDFKVPTESAAHFLAKGDATYLNTILTHCDEIPEADLLPGDLVMYRKPSWPIFTHAAIVINWPGSVIHAVEKLGVIMDRGTQGAFGTWERKGFRLK